jgi:protein associated with RNAse G/E
MRMHSTKYDGSLHYRYPVEVIDRSPDRLVTWTAPGAAVQSYRGAKTGVRNILSFFWLDRPYVLHALWDSAWQPQSLYVDIATGTHWSEDTVGYVDLDLDVILKHDSPIVLLDDEDEFAEHRVKFDYPAELVAQCHDAVAVVRGFLERRERPFTPDLFAWRPGAAVPKDGNSANRVRSTLTPPSS